MATSRAGLLEATISLDCGIQQRFPPPAIARRRLAAWSAIRSRRRLGGKAGKALEIAKIAQHTLQPFRRPMQAMEFAAHCDGFRQRFQHVAEAFDPDPKAVAA